MNRLSRDLLLILLPAILWAGLNQSRSQLIRLTCVENVASCTSERIPAFDRVTLGMESEEAHHLSFKTQNAAGYIAVGSIAVMHGFAILAKSLTPHGAALAFLTDLSFLLKVTVWNGVLNEIVKISTNRIRPHVYKHPEVAGDNPHHYTSFYSGHTSFTAAAGFGLVFLLVARRVRRDLVLAAFTSASVLTFTTGVLRVVAGRHFISDVVIGATMGFFWAWFWARRRRHLSET